MLRSHWKDGERPRLDIFLVKEGPFILITCEDDFGRGSLDMEELGRLC